ncbi:MAG: NAD(P)H-quinone oxidoreductase [Alphaproteobacteria bacterium]
MLAYQIEKSNSNRKLLLCKLPTPTIKDTEILIKTDSIGLNRADLYEVEGSYSGQDPNSIPGLEVAGTVIAIGNNVSSFKLGDKVCALLASGGYAEQVAAEEALTFLVPNNLNFEQAAALPEAIFTVFMNLVEKAHALKGQALLIHAAASGIGTIGIQIAKALGLKVISTASNDEKIKSCIELGSDYAFNYNNSNFISEILEATDNNKLDIILDCLGGEFFNHNIKLLKYGGKLLIIALLKGQYVNANLGPALVKNITIYNSTLRSQSLEYKSSLKARIETEIWPLVVSGVVKPVINKIFAFEKAQEALEYMKAGRHIGKIILKI